MLCSVVLDFAQALMNILYRKRKEHYITYKSGRKKSQIIDCLMRRKESIDKCKDCKVIPSGSVVT